MGLFGKKYDFENDHLRIEFSFDEMKYIMFYGQHRLKYDDLSRKTKKLLDNKNNDLNNNQNLLNEEITRAKTKLRFKKLKELGYTRFGFEYLGKIEGTMSQKVKGYLEKLTNEDNVLLGINRVGMNIDDERISDTFKNGLAISGHYVATTDALALSQNVSYYLDNKTIIKELMYADTYKDSKGSFLIRIPDEDLKGNIFMYDNNGDVRLNPKYVVGYVPLSQNHHIEDIILNSEHSLEKSYSFNIDNTYLEENDYVASNKRHK